ncbi:MAG TPA: Hsp20/alpha crystallin family protein, partial [Holophagaceae bacterium]|nr:Hsp20/alpha crystallin family protein [Holophagaceae bacterium]
MSGVLTRVAKKTEPAVFQEPFRNLSDLLRWDPFREASLWPQLPTAMEFSPSFDVKENDNAYVFTADMPGIKEEDLDVQLTGHRLTISGKRESEKKEEKDNYHLLERSYGSFSRTFTLPEETTSSKVDA